MTYAAANIDGTQAAVFMYHRFGEDKFPSTNIRIDQFEAHLKYLAKNQFHVLPLSKIVRALNNNEPLPDRTIAITIDDAYRSVYTTAFPLFRKYNFPFTVFVSAEAVDKKLSAFMTWEQLREMQEYGAEYGNHSYSHTHLIETRSGESTSEWKKGIIEDIQFNQNIMIDESVNPINFFAYPYGEYNLELAELVNDLGYVGFGQQSGVISEQSDRRILPRYAMAEKYAALNEFQTKSVTLPMPVKSALPWNPVLSDNNPPTLSIELGENTDIQLKSLRCYASQQGQIDVQWSNLNKNKFITQATSPFISRRNRYNCTALSNLTGRYYWYSHLWILKSITE
ncbi:MAG: polysaccharide deacetylase family protein [Gammaproteobacteria bacterium]